MDRLPNKQWDNNTILTQQPQEGRIHVDVDTHHLETYYTN